MAQHAKGVAEVMRLHGLAQEEVYGRARARPSETPSGVKNYSRHYLRARELGFMEAAIHWRRAEWPSERNKDAAEREERRWWALRAVPCADCAWPNTCRGVGSCYLTHSDVVEEREMPEANPKAARAVADGKVPLDYLEPIANEEIAKAIKSGADKYGRRNFADPGTEMLLSTYVGGLLRHVTALQRGEWYDPDSGLPHLAHIGANVHVVLAAREAGTLRYDTRDTKVTKRSDAVHGDGNMDAKGAAWGVR